MFHTYADDMKKGFTLVELLAVIVILALIALITIPVILNVVEKSKVKTYQRSIDSYGRAVEKGIAEYMMDNEGSNLSNITISMLEQQNYIKYEGNTVSCSPTESGINPDKTVYLKSCTVNGESVSYTYGEKQQTQQQQTTESNLGN